MILKALHLLRNTACFRMLFTENQFGISDFSVWFEPKGCETSDHSPDQKAKPWSVRNEAVSIRIKLTFGPGYRHNRKKEKWDQVLNWNIVWQRCKTSTRRNFPGIFREDTRGRQSNARGNKKNLFILFPPFIHSNDDRRLPAKLNTHRRQTHRCLQTNRCQVQGDVALAGEDALEQR